MMPIDALIASKEHTKPMDRPLAIYIGWDSKEPVAFSVLAHSILTRASRPVAIVPLTLTALRHDFTRPRGPTEATEFSLSRFMVPFLSHYEGWSIFMDSDMLCQVDIGDVLLHVLANPGKAVYCCPHDYIPRDLVKFDGHEQTTYPRKNWTSFLIFDNAKCQALTPEYVNTATGLQLHRFQWLADDQIGFLPLEWNWLVGEYGDKRDAKVLHFTRGTPCFEDYAESDSADLWWSAYAEMLKPARATEAALHRSAVKGAA